ncbi:MAG: hypothetical protein HQM08_11810 [Candidatus Riflebacteria bacterium]|nr:hypothetical protein [Candidatus Riflebacteria bacterium]
MKIKILRIFFIGLFFVFLCISNVRAIPSMLCSVPTTDILASHSAQIMLLAHYEFIYPDKALQPADGHLSSKMSGIEYGLSNHVEFGFDYVYDKKFERDGFYPTSFNLKWRILNEEKGSKFSMAIGSFFIGSKSFEDLNFTAFKASPYIVFTKKFTPVRLHLGYAENCSGYHYITYVENGKPLLKSNSGILCGIDGTLIKAKNPVTAYVDYIGGSEPFWGVGVSQPISPKWSWSYCYFKPGQQKLGEAESPSSHWVALYYTLFFK